MKGNCVSTKLNGKHQKKITFSAAKVAFSCFIQVDQIQSDADFIVFRYFCYGSLIEGLGIYYMQLNY